MTKVFIVKPSFLAKKGLMKELQEILKRECFCEKCDSKNWIENHSGTVAELVFNECFSQKNSVELTPSELEHIKICLDYRTAEEHMCNCKVCKALLKKLEGLK